MFCAFSTCSLLLWLLSHSLQTRSEPLSKPYVAHFTSPFNQTIPITSPNKTKRRPDSSSYLESDIAWNTNSLDQYRDVTIVDIRKALSGENNKRCPLDFTLGFATSHQSNRTLVQDTYAVGIHSSPVLYPIHPADSPGKSILFLRDYDYLDMITPTRYSPSWNATPLHDILTRDDQFPLLFEQSLFGYGYHPLIQDVDADGVPDAILVDYDGAIIIAGLDVLPQHEIERDKMNEIKRFYHQRQIPRLYLRKDWVDLSLNDTRLKQMASYGLDPYHSFFEYNSEAESFVRTVTTNSDGSIPSLPEITHDSIYVFRGVPGDILQLSVDMVQIQRQQQERMVDSTRRRRLLQSEAESSVMDHEQIHNEPDVTLEIDKDSSIVNQREGVNYYGDDLTAGFAAHGHGGDDYYPVIRNQNRAETEESIMRRDFYKDDHYIHLPPHVLTTPTYAEIPSRYNREKDPFSVEELLLIPVSYYFDEEEFSGYHRFKRFRNMAGGDETENLRGKFIASALVVYDLINQRFISNIHLDLSTDSTAPSVTHVDETNAEAWEHRRIGAFALASPTVADLDGDGVMEALIGTSMGIVYCLSLPYGYRNLGFPVQMKFPVEQPIVVEDVLGDRDLEVFILDSGGNIVCLNHNGGTIWHRALISNEEESRGHKMIKSSSMMLGDVDGNGSLDIVVTVLISKMEHPLRCIRIYVIDAKNGKDKENFPQEISMEDNEFYWDDYIAMLPNPLLVNLHSHPVGISYESAKADSVDATRMKGKVPHGGRSPGLHIVQPLKSVLYVFEGGSGCSQAIQMNFDVHSMVQVDDMHGAGTLDLVLTSTSGDVFTIDVSDVVPYHPLNAHPRPGLYVHGHSASTGIFVRTIDRKYRDILGVVFFLTMEIKDSRIFENQDRGRYSVEVRDGPSARRRILQKIYERPGVYTEKIYIPYGPGYYTLSLRMKTDHGMVYEDTFHLGYNVNYSFGLISMLLYPLVTAIVCLIALSRVKRKDAE